MLVLFITLGQQSRGNSYQENRSVPDEMLLIRKRSDANDIPTTRGVPEGFIRLGLAMSRSGAVLTHVPHVDGAVSSPSEYMCAVG